MSSLLPERRAIEEFGSLISNEIALNSAVKDTGYTGILRPRERLADYMQVVFGLDPAPHHQVWIRALEDESLSKVCIICPPGHAKTTVAGVAYPSWKIGNYPERHFLYYGNTMLQARKQSVAIRDLTQTEVYQSIFPVRRSPKGWAGDRWFLERPDIWDKDPTMMALGVDGPALGARTDEILFDDVCDLENMNTAESRKKVRNKIVAVAFSRQSGASKKTRMVSVMTRWHEDDLAKLFEEQGFTIIWMPALGYWEIVSVAPLGVNSADCEAPLALDEGKGHRHPPQTLSEIADLAAAHDLEQGQPLWPEEYPLEFFNGFREEEDIWQLEYMGLATRPGGNAFRTEQFRIWDNFPAKLEDAPRPAQLDPNRIRGIYQFWDTASKKGDANDFWAGTTWAWATDGLYMLEVFCAKMEFPEGVRKMEELYRSTYEVEWLEDGQLTRRSFSPRHIYVEETGQNNGAACVQTLNEHRIPATGLTPLHSKEERAAKTQVYLDERPVYFPVRPGAYVGAVENSSGRQPLTFHNFVGQFLSFPRGRKDDIVDSVGMALEHFRSFPVNAGDEWKSRLSANTLLTRAKVPLAPKAVARGSAVPRRITRGYFSGRGRKG